MWSSLRRIWSGGGVAYLAKAIGNTLLTVGPMSRILILRRSRLHIAGVAQLVEQLICNQPVVGSNPIASSNQINWIADCLAARPLSGAPLGSGESLNLAQPVQHRIPFAQPEAAAIPCLPVLGSDPRIRCRQPVLV
jgi:hypothetical protein